MVGTVLKYLSQMFQKFSVFIILIQFNWISAAILSLLTVVGNIMVMISFKIDKQLQTISNYFLFSLAVADFAIGLISMPLFTISTLLGKSNYYYLSTNLFR